MADEPTTTPAAEPTAEPTPAAEPPDPKDKTLTQAEVDRIVEDRLKRERTKYADYSDLKKKAERFDEIEAENKSELEKEREAREAAEKSAGEAVERANNTLRRAAIVAEAAKQGADADLVVALLKERDFKVAKGDEEFTVAIDKDGAVTGAEGAVKALVAEKPSLAGEPSSPDFDNGARPPVPEPKDPGDAHNEFILGITGHLNK
jgi:hypothetical protein